MTSLVEIPAQTAMVVRKTIVMSDMREAQQTAFASLAAAGLANVGQRITIWRVPEAGRMDYAPGRLVAQPAAPQGEVIALELPAGRAAHVRFVGGYEGLGAAWGRLFADCAREGWALTGLNWEIYTEGGSEPTTELYAMSI